MILVRFLAAFYTSSVEYLMSRSTLDIGVTSEWGADRDMTFLGEITGLRVVWKVNDEWCEYVAGALRGCHLLEPSVQL
jgi:hypothetical protein